MTLDIIRAMEEFGSVLGVCPCCGEVFRLSDARPYAKGRRPATAFDRLEGEEHALERAVERLDEREDALREKARERGRREAKRRLKRIDPVFSASGIDPQDVKVIFDPVEYVVFDGRARHEVKRVVLMARPPADRARERVHRSIEKALGGGNIAFLTLGVSDAGCVTCT